MAKLLAQNLPFKHDRQTKKTNDLIRFKDTGTIQIIYLLSYFFTPSGGEVPTQPYLAW